MHLHLILITLSKLFYLSLRRGDYMTKKILFSSFIFISSFSIVLSDAKASQNYAGYGDPTGYEQIHLEAINRARSAPLVEAQRLGIDLNEGPPDSQLDGSAKQPLVSNAKLLNAARLHTQDMLTNSYFSHYSLDGRDPWDRLEDQGYEYGYVGENLAWRGTTGTIDPVAASLLLHDDLFVDDDYPGRGHRVNILISDFKEAGVGIACGPYQQGATTYNSCMVTCDFGASRVDTRPFLTGVVYEDKNSDGMYSYGEGLSGVEVKAVETGENTTTASAGGYALPLFSGSYTIALSHPNIGSIKKSVMISDVNVKLDTLKSEFVMPQNILQYSQSNTIIKPGQRLRIRLGEVFTQDFLLDGVAVDISYSIKANQTLYVVVVVPWNAIYSVTGLNAFKEGVDYYPGSSGSLIDLYWPDDRTLDGVYDIYAVVTVAGSDPLNIQNWLDHEIIKFNATK